MFKEWRQVLKDSIFKYGQISPQIIYKIRQLSFSQIYSKDD